MRRNHITVQEAAQEDANHSYVSWADLQLNTGFGGRGGFQSVLVNTLDKMLCPEC